MLTALSSVVCNGGSKIHLLSHNVTNPILVSMKLQQTFLSSNLTCEVPFCQLSANEGLILQTTSHTQIRVKNIGVTFCGDCVKRINFSHLDLAVIYHNIICCHFNWVTWTMSIKVRGLATFKFIKPKNLMVVIEGD